MHKMGEISTFRICTNARTIHGPLKAISRWEPADRTRGTDCCFARRVVWAGDIKADSQGIQTSMSIGTDLTTRKGLSTRLMKFTRVQATKAIASKDISPGLLENPHSLDPSRIGRYLSMNQEATLQPACNILCLNGCIEFGVILNCTPKYAMPDCPEGLSTGQETVFI